MKTSLFILITLLTFFSFAKKERIISNQSFSAEQLYVSLTANEYNPSPDNKSVVAKSVGGITCVRVKNGNRGFIYECGLDKIESFCQLKFRGSPTTDADARIPKCEH